ncbi:hypothetical protein [Agrobacterium vitis]|nr:hypothetical protein [Agrobacterium vitis]
MKEVTTVGIDIAKSVFQAQGINAVADVVIRRNVDFQQILSHFFI